MKSNQPQDYFPKNYVSSRQRFQNLIRQIPEPCEVGFWKVPSLTDDDLLVDHALLPATQSPENLLVILSGIHGSETYAGAAIIELFLQEILPEIDRSQLGIFIVHAMNPYGFKNHRRCTENKVNLNRNFSVSGKLFEIRNENASKLNEMIISRNPVKSLRSHLLESMQVKNDIVYFSEISSDELIKGISPGQFERRDDLEYGGGKAEPQTDALIKKMQQIMPDYRNIVALDLHTGLGHRGRLHLLTDGEEPILKGSLFSKIFKPEENKKYYEFTPSEAEGFYKVHGATNSMFTDLQSIHQNVCAVTLEFGTLGHSPEQQITDLNLSLLDHEGYHYGFVTAELETEIRALNLEKSYPNDDSWRLSILQAAEGLLTRIISRLNS